MLSTFFKEKLLFNFVTTGGRDHKGILSWLYRETRPLSVDLKSVEDVETRREKHDQFIVGFYKVIFVQERSRWDSPLLAQQF